MRSLCMGTILEDIILPFPRLPESEKETLAERVLVARAAVRPAR